jgi:hypothetical protein
MQMATNNPDINQVTLIFNLFEADVEVVCTEPVDNELINDLTEPLKLE